jgi:hypothetical protein
MIAKEIADGGWTQPMQAVESVLVGGADHTVAGCIIAESWKLGNDIQEVISRHHAEKSGNAFANLIAVANFVAGGIYPFPENSAGPTKGLFAADGPALDDALKEKLKPFLSEFLLPQYGLRVDDVIEAGRAIETTVRKLVENLRSSA